MYIRPGRGTFAGAVLPDVSIGASPMNRVTQVGRFSNVRRDIVRTGCLSLEVVGGISETQIIGVGEIARLEVSKTHHHLAVKM